MLRLIPGDQDRQQTDLSQEIDVNQEFESLESRMAEIRYFTRLSEEQQRNLVRCFQVDPVEVAGELFREAGRLFRATCARRYL